MGAGMHQSFLTQSDLNFFGKDQTEGNQYFVPEGLQDFVLTL